MVCGGIVGGWECTGLTGVTAEQTWLSFSTHPSITASSSPPSTVLGLPSGWSCPRLFLGPLDTSMGGSGQRETPGHALAPVRAAEARSVWGGSGRRWGQLHGARQPEIYCFQEEIEFGFFVEHNRGKCPRISRRFMTVPGRTL